MTAEFSMSPSSVSTRSASRATAQASGLPPKVEPCSPGFSTPSTSRFASMADTGVEAAAERLADQRDVGLDAFVLLGEQRAGAAEPGLDLVQYHQHVVVRAKPSHAPKIALGRDHHAGLALDRLRQHRHGVGPDRPAPAPRHPRTAR